MIGLDDFLKIELRVGTVLEAEEVPGSDKLIKLKVDLGPEILKPVQDDEGGGDDKNRDIRQILAGIKQWYKPKDFVGKQVVVVANLELRVMMGLESAGMMLAADPSTALGTSSVDGPIFLTVPKKVPPGTKIH